MSNNLHFLYGSNEYLLQQKLKQLKLGSNQKYGEFNVQDLRFSAETANAIATEILTPPLFGDGRRIIFLYDFPPDKFNDKIKKSAEILLKILLEQLPEEVVVICVATKVDRRTAVFKQLSKAALAQEFKAWESDRFNNLPPEAIKFVQKRLRCDGKLAQFLLDYVGLDGFKLHNETLKLALSGQAITKELIEENCLASEGVRAFAFTNALQSGKLQTAVKVLAKLFSSGESPTAIFLRDVTPSIRQLLQTKIAIEQGADAKAAGLHPFVFGKWKALANKISLIQLKQAHAALLQIDLDSKTGLLPAVASQWQWRILQVMSGLLA